MKANAPEKIYIHVVDDGEEMWHYATCKRENVDNIEYTRTDVFIEKARKWFEKQNEWFDLDGNRHCDMEDFDDFKNYMKGE